MTRPNFTSKKAENHPGYKEYVRDEVSLPQASRLLHESIGPLQAKPSNQLWRAFPASSEDVEGLPDGEDYLCIQPVPVFKNPFLLLRAAETHPYDICAACINLGAHHFIFPLAEVHEGGGILPRNVDTGVTKHQLPRGSFRYTYSTAV